MAEALYPGYLNTYLKNASGYITTIVTTYGSRWVARMGFDDVFAEAMYGALKGLVGWLLHDGPFNSDAPTIQTYILRGVLFHFGKSVPWYTGPIRVNVRAWERDPDGGPKPIDPDVPDDFPGWELAAFEDEDDGVRAVDDTDAFDGLAAKVLAAADRADSSGTFRAVIDLRHGLTSGRAMTFKEIGAVYRIRKQAAYQRYQRAVSAVRELLTVSVDGPAEIG